MSTTNPVYNVLATAGNQAPLAAGSPVSSLANGQIGVFNFHTGLSVDGTNLAVTQDIFIAVGINRTTGGTNAMEDFSKSAGQMIQTKLARSLTVKGYVPDIAKVVLVTGFNAKCDKDYALKIEVRNQQNYFLNGYNQIAKTYNFRTGCCTQIDCVTCPQGDCNELGIGLVNNINNDPEKVFTATLFGNKLLATIGDPTTDGTAIVAVGGYNYNVALLAADGATQAAAKVAAAINSDTNSPYVASSNAAVVTAYPKKSAGTNTALITLVSAGGTAVTVGTTSNANVDVAVVDTDAFKLAYPGVCLSIKITNNPQIRTSANSDININYHKSGFDFVVSAVEGFVCNGTITEVTPTQTKEGSGYDLKQLEYFAKGWGKPGPYRTRAITGLPNSAESFINEASNYNVVSLKYDEFSVGGWLEYLNNLETIVAIPCADTTTLTGLFTILDPIFPQFGAMTNDVASMACNNTNISTINNYALDGIESLA